MKHLVIVGAGGMGRCICDIAKGSIGYDTEFVIKGFIDDDVHVLDEFPNYPMLLGTINEYCIEENDVFVCSLGDTQIKRNICESLKETGATFQSLIHHTAVVGTNTIIGNGTIVSEYAIVSPDTIIGENTLVQNFAVVGHDCKIGNYVRIDTHCTCVGGTIVNDGATMHTSAVINHKVEVGENAVIGACSFVVRNVKPNTTVWGNPAKTLKF